MTYYVIGGVYMDLSFSKVLDCETYGPFATYEEAYDVWQAKARFNVDNACHRLTIETQA